jgi:UDP-N-acetylmuramate: L-alanyl-gamma-D-glutamyl-meso-diaminopimelate ligase
MAPLACLLQARGHFVTGSDGPLYPPMSDLLRAAGIRAFEGYDAAHLAPAPDVVVVGNAVRRDNAEAVEAERLGLTRLSMPETLARYFLADRRPLVVAGTHGKTTTSAMAAWAWSQCGRAPGFLIGGVPIDLGASFRLGDGERFVVEGDEYNAAYFDRGAKFLHYQPETLLLTSVEYDHADLYPTPQSLLDAYARLIDLVPESGLIVACGDSAEVRQLAAAARAEVIFYGEDKANDVRLLGVSAADSAGIRFHLGDEGGAEHELAMPLWGVHNALNALAVWTAGRRDGLDAGALARAFAAFRGVKRRQELLADRSGIVVIDDFAHHPTAVEKTLASIRMRYPGRRVLACFEPRSLTAGRAFLLAGYSRAFALADRAYFAPIFHHARLAPEERLDLATLAAGLSGAGTPCVLAPDLESLRQQVLAEAKAGDVVLTMSSGSFGGLPRALADAFMARD